MAHHEASPSRDRGTRAAGAPGNGLRVLVTNPWNGQAYCVLRALRPHASRLVATRYEEHGLLGRLAPAAVSRFTDAVYPVPLAAADWQRGRMRDDNSRGETMPSGPLRFGIKVAQMSGTFVEMREAWLEADRLDLRIGDITPILGRAPGGLAGSG